MRLLLAGAIVAATVAGVGRPGAVAAEATDVSPEQLRLALEGAVAWLKQTQKADGTWPEWTVSKQPSGVTSLCALALLEAGIGPDDVHVRKALTHLRGLSPERINTTYTVSLQTMVFCRAEPDKDRALIQRNVRWLEKNQVSEGPTRGSWSYPGFAGDNSNSQFALLALHEAERAGVKVDPRAWRLAKVYWEDCQNEDGSFGYHKDFPGTGSMTCAGITSLIIASDMIHQADATVEGEKIVCCRRAESGDDRIQRALDWLGGHFSVEYNPPFDRDTRQAWLLYYLYGVERVGRMTANRFIGGHDWYREGAEYLLRLRGGKAGVAMSAGWKGVGFENLSDHVSTSFAMLFLAKGRRPTLMAKLQHGSGKDWSQHRSDVANLTRHTELCWKRDLTWQVVRMEDASIDDLNQSPVLYYSGSSDPLPGTATGQKELATKLRGYIDRGGFLFAEADCGGSGFDDGFRRLMALAFPEPEYRLHRLSPEHPVWRTEVLVDPLLRPLEGIEFGCRTSVVYAPWDKDGNRPSLSCLWELSRTGREREYPQGVQRQVKTGLALGVNVLAYATNRQLKYKYEAWNQPGESHEADPARRGKLYLASLKHPGGCNVAPRALPNLLDAAANELKIRVSPEQHEVAATDQQLFRYHLVFVHGRNSFEFTKAEREQLRKYVERGGMILADSICASTAFTESFRREMAAIFPDHPLKSIPPDDPLFSTAYGGFDLSSVEQRVPQPSTDGGPLRDVVRKGPPILEAIQIDDRYGVVFSPYDLSCALERQTSLECRGYARGDAARIGLNVLMYSLQK